jgi:hypothetical protein
MTKRPKRATLSEQLREFMLKGPKTRGQIHRETGVAESNMSEFVNGRRAGFSFETLDLIGECLGLRLVMDPPGAAHPGTISSEMKKKRAKKA